MAVIPASMNPKLKELKLLLAEGMHQWSLLELALSHLFASQVGTKHPLAYIIWDSVISFDAKLSCLNAVLNFNLKDDDLKALWGRLGDRIQKANSLRNQLAHSGYLSNSKDVYLVPYLSVAAIVTKPKEIKRLKENDLKIREETFKALVSATQWFSIVANPGSQPDSKDVLKAPDLITELRGLIFQTPVKPKRHGR
ncbi:MAG: hypothetical protein ACAH80_08080 [Alphaproteobacteria bacterium]